MAFVGKNHKLGRHAAELQCCIELEALIDRYAEIELAAGYERRGIEILDKFIWRPALVIDGIFPGHAFEFPIDEPELLGRAGHAFQVVNAGMRDERLEFKARIVVVSEEPIDHVAAITCAGGANAIAVDERLLNNGR